MSHDHQRMIPQCDKVCEGLQCLMRCFVGLEAKLEVATPALLNTSTKPLADPAACARDLSPGRVRSVDNKY